jgi:hypothetical protein
MTGARSEDRDGFDLDQVVGMGERADLVWYSTLQQACSPDSRSTVGAAQALGGWNSTDDGD